MSRQLLSIILVLCFSWKLQAQISIAEARLEAQGTTGITIKGIVLNGQELGPIRYVQDATAAIPVYDPAITSLWNVGDEVQLTGAMGIFQGLMQLTATSNTSVLSTGNSVTPLVVPPSEVGGINEAKLIQVNNVTFDEAGSTIGVGNYNFTDNNGETGTIYVRTGHPLIGEQLPLFEADLVGISSQFNGAVQILPRSDADFLVSSDFYILSTPEVSNITNNSLTFSWETNISSSSGVRYGLTPALELGNQTNSQEGTLHQFTLNNLQPATVYYIQPYSVAPNDAETTAATGIYVTASNSTGAMQVYFNHSIDPTVATTTAATYLAGPQMEQKLIEFINSAQATIDVAVYNNSRAPLVEALNAAVDRGVRVRYIYDAGTLNSALQDGVADFQVLSGNGDDLMHNKFMVIDVASEDGSWVMGGSMNWTDENIGDDYNNTIFIQDQSLAKVYTLEFEEMWGGSGDTPGIFSAHFGNTKSANTPTQLNINGKKVEVYFSPTDYAAAAITRTIESADETLDFAILSMTLDGVGSAIAQEFNDDVTVHGLMENINDQGSEYSFLTNTVGVDVMPHEAAGQIHHKYAIVDAAALLSDPIVATGSFNWSAGAESRNDENLLLIHDAGIANLYYQEFTQRWCEVTNGDCYVGVPIVATLEGATATLFPNIISKQQPVNISIELAEAAEVSYRILNINGQQVGSDVNLGTIAGSSNTTLNVNNFVAGTYWVLIKIGDKGVLMRSFRALP
ncbi:MAG: hypothetical protein IPL35_10490 [Sphingobacteriales bacterium]|nr:hypothetical protein [Sphingobacteriales bacterium]